MRRGLIALHPNPIEGDLKGPHFGSDESPEEQGAWSAAVTGGELAWRLLPARNCRTETRAARPFGS